MVLHNTLYMRYWPVSQDYRAFTQCWNYEAMGYNNLDKSIPDSTAVCPRRRQECSDVREPRGSLLR
jgi:hypothetical protein